MILVVLAPAIAALLVGGVALSLRVQRRGQLRLVGSVIDPAPETAARHEPSVLFFSSVTCTICHTAQRPALDALSDRLNRAISIREIDVAQEPEMARRYRVMSLPTTVVLGVDGEVTSINVGFASAEKLSAQVAQVQGLVPASR